MARLGAVIAGQSAPVEVIEHHSRADGDDVVVALPLSIVGDALNSADDLGLLTP